MNLIIFDIDGTLCWSNNLDDQCFIQAFENVLSIKIEETNWDNYINITDHGIIEQLYNEHFNRNPDIEIFKKIKDRYLFLLRNEIERNERDFQEIPGALSFIKILKKERWIVGIATGGFQNTANFKLKKLGLNIDNYYIFYSDIYKTKREIIDSVINETKRMIGREVLNRIIYVGDRPHDYEIATYMNLEFLGIDFKKTGLLKKIGVKNVISDFLDFKNLNRILKI